MSPHIAADHNSMACRSWSCAQEGSCLTELWLGVTTRESQPSSPSFTPLEEATCRAMITHLCTEAHTMHSTSTGSSVLLHSSTYASHEPFSVGNAIRFKRAGNCIASNCHHRSSTMCLLSSASLQGEGCGITYAHDCECRGALPSAGGSPQVCPTAASICWLFMESKYVCSLFLVIGTSTFSWL